MNLIRSKQIPSKDASIALYQNGNSFLVELMEIESGARQVLWETEHDGTLADRKAVRAMAYGAYDSVIQQVREGAL